MEPEYTDLTTRVQRMRSKRREAFVVDAIAYVLVGGVFALMLGIFMGII